jgi:hypothetical protein
MALAPESVRATRICQRIHRRERAFCRSGRSRIEPAESGLNALLPVGEGLQAMAVIVGVHAGACEGFRPMAAAYRPDAGGPKA